MAFTKLFQLCKGGGGGNFFVALLFPPTASIENHCFVKPIILLGSKTHFEPSVLGDFHHSFDTIWRVENTSHEWPNKPRAFQHGSCLAVVWTHDGVFFWILICWKRPYAGADILYRRSFVSVGTTGPWRAVACRGVRAVPGCAVPVCKLENHNSRRGRV